MRTVFFGVNGEGLGHATRAISVIERLNNCRVHVFTFGKAYKFFSEIYNPDLLHEISGIMFQYRGSRVDGFRSIKSGVEYFLRQCEGNIKFICKKALELKPDLFITDFEPSMARAAHRMKGTLLSIDNQHKFSHCYMGDIPFSIKPYCFVVNFFTRWFIPSPDKIIISTFHDDCEQPRQSKNLMLVNGLMRKSFEYTPVSDDGTVLVYVRPSVENGIMQSIMLAGCHTIPNYRSGLHHTFHVFGGTSSGKVISPHIHMHPLSPEFVKRMACCKAIIAPGGNQLISEARFFGKPILVIPEPGQYEQYVNAHYVNKLNIGQSCHLNKLTSYQIHCFLTKFVPNFKPNARPNGVHKVVKFIEEQINVR
jgi:uncharacterized protein (TIGR00661 family)